MRTSQDQWSTKNLQSFWDSVFDNTREMAGISSTVYFANREKEIIVKWFGNLNGKKLFKSDLWDEVKNTKLLLWADQQGADCYGVDISSRVIQAVKKQAKYISAKQADIRKIPFPDNSFDRVIQIGTVEHFPDTIVALRELQRIMKPGGVAMMSVPVKYDLWGRFIFIGILQALGLYKYGYEIQYSRSKFRQLLLQAGFEIIGSTGYLIFPSPLRILDYACHELGFKWGNRLVDVILRQFYKIETKFEFLSKWGYMAAFKCTKISK